ncbi:MAG TPA: hypothetical protein VMB52_06065 [Verrucomicrobiae bacterium]|nr:hypothetical protein [Verrucomicrobiae bacterium]
MNPQTPSPQAPVAAAPVPPTPEPPVNPAPAQPMLPNVPDVWPKAWGLYKYSKQAVKRNVGTMVLLIVAYVIIAYVPAFFLNPTLGRIVEYLLEIPFVIAFIVGYVACVRDQKISFGTALKAGLDPMLYLKYIATSLLLGIAITFSLLLLIVPFFIVLPRLALAPFFLIDKKQGPIKAISSSWTATKGHSGKIWGVFGATIAMALLILTVVGIPFAVYFLFMYAASQALLYEFITRTDQSAATTANGETALANAAAAPTPISSQPQGSPAPTPSVPQPPVPPATPQNPPQPPAAQ